MCRCDLHAALWSHIGRLMRLFAAEPRCIAGLLFSCQYLCLTILVTPCSMLWDWRVQELGQCLFIPRFLFVSSFLSPPIFLFSSFILWFVIMGLGSSDWYCVNRSLPALHYQPFFNNNNNNLWTNNTILLIQMVSCWEKNRLARRKLTTALKLTCQLQYKSTEIFLQVENIYTQIFIQYPWYLRVEYFFVISNVVMD